MVNESSPATKFCLNLQLLQSLKIMEAKQETTV